MHIGGPRYYEKLQLCFGLFLALAKLLGWNARKRFLNMLAASGPGDFSTNVAGCWTTHVFSLIC
jgi:hypothetical protein